MRSISSLSVPVLLLAGVVAAGARPEFQHVDGASSIRGKKIDNLMSGVDRSELNARSLPLAEAQNNNANVIAPVNGAQNDGLDVNSLLNNIAQGRPGPQGQSVGQADGRLSPGIAQGSDISGDIANQIAGGNAPSINQILNGLGQQAQDQTINQSSPQGPSQAQDVAGGQGNQGDGGNFRTIQALSTIISEVNGQQLPTDIIQEVGGGQAQTGLPTSSTIANVPQAGEAQPTQPAAPMPMQDPENRLSSKAAHTVLPMASTPPALDTLSMTEMMASAPAQNAATGVDLAQVSTPVSATAVSNGSQTAVTVVAGDGQQESSQVTTAMAPLMTDLPTTNSTGLTADGLLAATTTTAAGNAITVEVGGSGNSGNNSMTGSVNGDAVMSTTGAAAAITVVAGGGTGTGSGGVAASNLTESFMLLNPLPTTSTSTSTLCSTSVLEANSTSTSTVTSTATMTRTLAPEPALTMTSTTTSTKTMTHTMPKAATSAAAVITISAGSGSGANNETLAGGNAPPTGVAPAFSLDTSSLLASNATAATTSKALGSTATKSGAGAAVTVIAGPGSAAPSGSAGPGNNAAAEQIASNGGCNCQCACPIGSFPMQAAAPAPQFQLSSMSPPPPVASTMQTLVGSSSPSSSTAAAAASSAVAPAFSLSAPAPASPSSLVASNSANLAASSAPAAPASPSPSSSSSSVAAVATESTTSALTTLSAQSQNQANGPTVPTPAPEAAPSENGLPFDISTVKLQSKVTVNLGRREAEPTGMQVRRR